MADVLESDADVGLAPSGLETDADVGIKPQPSWWERGAVKPTTLTMDPSLRTAPYVQDVMTAFGHGAKEGFGADKLGISKESAKTLSELGWFRKEGRDNYDPSKAFYELLAHTVVGAGDILLRSGTALFRGAQEAAVEAGLPRDVAAIPEAFFGSPHPTGVLKVEAAKAEPVRRPEVIPDTPFTAEPGKPAPVPDIPLAKDLGVIGPEKPEPTFKDSPSELAEQAVPRSLSAASTPDEMKGRPRGHEPGEYDARGKEWIDKIEEPDDVRQAIENIATNNDYFPEARGGVASPQARLAVAEAAGIDPAAIDASHFAEHFDNDGKVRAVIQALRQTAKDFAEASDRAVKEPSVENAAALAEAQMRHTHVLEYTMGLRAESGRSLAAWKDLLRETEHTKATVAIRADEQTGKAPVGTAAVVDAAKEVRDNLKAGKKPGLQKLVDQAKELVDKEEAVGKPRVEMDPALKGMVNEASKTLKQLKATEEKTPAGFQRLITAAENLVGATEKSAKEKLPLSPELSGLVDEAKTALKGLKGEKTPAGFQKLIDAAERLVGETQKTPEKRAPLSPELTELVGEARKTLKRFGVDKDAELEKFKQSLEQLSSGSGKISDTVEVARELLRKLEKAKEEKEPKAPSERKASADRGKLMGAAKRLVAATDKLEPEAKAPVSAEMQGLMETARQAVGRIKTQGLASELAAFKSALNDKDPVRAAAAANELIEAEGKRKTAGEPKPPVEHDQLMAAALRVAAAAEKDGEGAVKPALPKDITAILDEAKGAVGELQKSRESVLANLIEAAENQVINLVKNKAVKNPVEALPPELQALVDKTQRVTDRFGGIAKGERAALLLARTGRTVAEQEQLARSVSGLTPNQVAKVLENLRASPEAKKQGWGYWLWQEGLISGAITHTGYAVVNTATVFVERVAAPLLAAVAGRVRGQNVSMMAPIYANTAFVHSLPDAFRAAGEAFRTGQRVPLASEMRLFERGEESPQAKGASTAFNMTTGPDWGIWKRVFNEDQLESAARALGIPGRAANLMHTFFKVLSENASATTRAYEAAFQEGAKGDKFWERYNYHREFPTDDALRGAVNDAYTGAFMGRLGPKTEQWSHTIKSNPVGKWLFPFQHIPLNIERMTMEYSPFAVLGPEMRAALKGEKGEPAQNLAFAKMAIGSSIIGYFMHKQMTGDATSHYPLDPEERRKWELLRMQPNSIKVGKYWFQAERLGPIGNVANIGAALGEVVQHYQHHEGTWDEAITSAMWTASVAAANQVGNEVGFQTLRNLMDAFTNEKKAERFWDQQVASFVPAFTSQIAGFTDPYARKASGILDALKYRLPLARETILPKRDPLNGEMVPNPGYHAFKRQGEINVDLVKMELDRIKLYPAAPEDRISGVKLTPAMYDRYQAIAGPLVYRALEMAINMPGYYDLPVGVQQDVLKGAINSNRKAAQALMQVGNMQIINQAVENRIGRLQGKKAQKLKE